MLEVIVVGDGCAGCLKTEQAAIEALQALGIPEARLQREADPGRMEHLLLGDAPPGLLINGRLVWAGSVPKRDQVIEWLREALDAVAA
ncbi:MAG: thioredoxin family protein [Anaerolineales bacterium]